MSGFDAEVIVVGGGPAGSATAWMLARGGRDVLILDRASFPRPKVCAEYISPEACRLLESMDVLAAAERAGAVRLTGMQVRSPNGTVLVGEFGAARERTGTYVDGLALRRERLDSLVLDAARRAGARVRECSHVADVSRDASGRVDGIVLADGTPLRARFVVGADGLRSVVARRLALGSRSRWPRRVAFVTHYRGIDGMGPHGEMHVERDGYVGLARVDSDLVNVAVVVPVRLAKSAATDIGAFIDEWIHRRPHLARRFANATRETVARGVGPFGWQVRRAWVPGAAVVGDAADFFDPFTGEGIYAALRGGELLAPYIHVACDARLARDEQDALRAYDRARRDAFGGKWKLERLVGCAVSWPLFMNRVARGLAKRRDLADTFVGVTGDVVPARAVLRPSYVVALAHASLL